MSGIVTGKPRMSRGPETFQVYQAVNAGQLTCPGTAGNAALVGVAGANAINCLGVATQNALPAGTAYTGNSGISGYPLVEAQIPDENLAVAAEGDFVLNMGGTVAFGQYIKCGAAGVAVAWVDGTDTAGTRIGKCIDPGGGVNGGTALCKIRIT